MRAQFLSVRIDVQTQLRKDSELDVVWADYEVVVVAVCFCAGLDEAVTCADYIGGGFRTEGGLQDFFAAH